MCLYMITRSEDQYTWGILGCPCISVIELRKEQNAGVVWLSRLAGDEVVVPNVAPFVAAADQELPSCMILRIQLLR